MCYETVKKEIISKHTFYLVNYRSRLSTCTSSILENKHQTGLQTNEQHQRSAESYRTRRPRDHHESVCWTWLGH